MNTIRHGGTYIVVLMASLIVAMMALSSIQSVRWHARDGHAEIDVMQSAFGADIGLEYALGQINHNPNWRTAHTNNVDTTPFVLNGIMLRYRLIDEDGSLTDDPLDQCDVLVTASSGYAKQCVRATLDPVGNPLGCLSYSIACSNMIRVTNSGMLAADQSMASNNKVQVLGSDAHLTGDCFSTGTMTGNIYGTTNSLPSAVALPTGNVADSYLPLATTIPITDLPLVLGRRYIDKQLLSKSHNTINGNVNTDGIYHIDCGGAMITIQDSRLECTLILQNSNSDSYIEGSVYWSAPEPNYPILLLDQNFKISMGRSPLLESTVGINLNPAGTPYRGLSDTNTTTAYPAVLRGLIYSTKKLDFTSVAETEIFGCIISGHQMAIDSGSVFMHYSDVFANNPPPGFTDGAGQVHLVPGSVHRVLAP